jgi:hypothetical protein
MQQTQNPWITRTAADEPVMDRPAAPQAAVISAPLRGMIEPDAADRLETRSMAGAARLWVVGTHGGSGESRITELIEFARSTDHCWPVLPNGSPPPVLLTCRADARGLTTARNVLTQWASGATPQVNLLGLAVLADAPGKTPKALRDFAALVGGGAPRLWSLPWVDAWRHADTTESPAAREYQRFITDMAALATTTTHRKVSP